MKKLNTKALTRIILISKALTKLVFILTLVLALFLAYVFIQTNIMRLFESEKSVPDITKTDSEESIKEAVDEYVKDSVLSLDYEEEQKTSSTTDYSIFFTYDRDIGKTKLVLLESTGESTTIKEFSDYAYTLTTNYALQAYEYNNYLIFSIESKIFGCGPGEGEWCPEYINQIRVDAKYSGIYRLNLETSQLERILEYDVHDDPYILFTIAKNTKYILMTSVNYSNGYEEDAKSYEVSILNVETGEITTIFTDR